MTVNNLRVRELCKLVHHIKVNILIEPYVLTNVAPEIQRQGRHMPWALRLATLFAGRRLDEKECGDCVTERMSAGQQSSLRLWRGAF